MLRTKEYMIPRNSMSLCFYDTRGFSNNLTQNLEMIKQWMTKGVRHGESMKRLILLTCVQIRTQILIKNDFFIYVSASDSSSQRGRMKCKNG
ncbi:hypothetical protein HanRHA438_Chr07g0303871 [Helianthus annuus]|nr:hypothetical protein HanHA300_Chr07g0241271 [Helianthus annuus]KAJ0556677.1 hypothetical protein HanIR_Chr07g0316541 [Helianthus annuus]KAJ0563027.1 hypothetical protein HanHA89_Chr07g0258431 [Helianthus annuus]KAJ0728397.1 hypothetical protein HanLR1_Chr07g0241131 [Helianthus annuus]KAJ0731155.1 hypothetical protein HanOQP8_Chr07g0248711 [Helianthus annuus]